MKLFIFGTLVGATVGIYLMNLTVDWSSRWEASKDLAANSALLGCVQVGSLSYEECQAIAREHYKELSELDRY